MTGRFLQKAGNAQGPVIPTPIIAVAGHIDHGKTALVRALTGIETDRLPEEKRRGISIEVGVAHWKGETGSPLPPLSFVDVPGHERYLRNMIAGIHGARVALLVIACDDGVMPQTLEHTAILKMIGISHWVVALSKADLLSQVDLEASRASIARWLSEQAIPAEIFPVSAHHASGLPELSAHLGLVIQKVADDAELASSALLGSDQRAVRLCVDRTFVAKGDGLIATGVLSSGVLSRGEAVTIAPAGIAARIRGIQVAGEAVEHVRAGTRCAINLAGLAVDAESVQRGDWLVDASLNHPVTRIDAWIRGLDPRAAPRRQAVFEAQLHIGTARVTARVAIRHRAACSSNSAYMLARLHTTKPVIAVVGDRWIVRSADGAQTLGVAEVAWPFIDAHGLRGEAHANLLKQLMSLPPADWLAHALALLPAGMRVAHFQAAWALRDRESKALSESAGAIVAGKRDALSLVDASRLKRVEEQLVHETERYHAKHPESMGLEWQHAIVQLPRADRRFYAAQAMARLQSGGALTRSGDRILRPGHVPAPSAQDVAFRERVLPILSEPRSRSVHELSEMLELPVDAVRTMLNRLALQGHAIAVTPHRFIAVERMKLLAASALDAAQAGVLHAAEFSRRTGIGRNLSIDVLEFFDRIRLTRRVGDRRIVLDAQALCIAPKNPSLRDLI